MDLKPALGASTSFSKTVSESDVYLFAGILTVTGNVWVNCSTFSVGNGTHVVTAVARDAAAVPR